MSAIIRITKQKVSPLSFLEMFSFFSEKNPNYSEKTEVAEANQIGVSFSYENENKLVYLDSFKSFASTLQEAEKNSPLPVGCSITCYFNKAYFDKNYPISPIVTYHKNLLFLSGNLYETDYTRKTSDIDFLRKELLDPLEMRGESCFSGYFRWLLEKTCRRFVSGVILSATGEPLFINASNFTHTECPSYSVFSTFYETNKSLHIKKTTQKTNKFSKSVCV